MSTRPNWSRPIVVSIALMIISAFTFAAIGGSYASLFSAGWTSAESAPVLTSESAAMATIGTCDTAGPIEVESTGGTTTPTAYATLNDAFLAIIAGTHTGSINIEVCGNTTETVSATLTASGVGSASYTDITIRPVGGARTIEGSIVGAIIRLNGADNVTIDGRQGGAGTARDLTVRNNNTSTATAAIWLSSVAAGNGASSNVIRNLEIAAGQTANVGTNATFGIIQSGTTVSVTSADGNDNDNNQFIFNRVTRARYGIVSRGVTTNNNLNAVVTDNIVGPTSFGADEIGKAGIYMQADTGAMVSRNVVQFVGGNLANTTAGADRCGICIGNENWGQAEANTITSGDYTVTKNIVHDVVEERTFSAVGIRLGTTRSGVATNNLIANNFIYNVRADGTAGDQACGIGYAAGHTDRIVFNSISMTGDMDPAGTTAATIYGNGIRVSTINAANNVNLTLMNNSIYVDVNSNTATNLYYAITLPSAAYVFGTGGLNYNNYYVNQANPQMRTGGLGVTSGNNPGTSFQTLANWQAALTAPQDANSIQADPLYFSNTTDLHIQPASPNVNVGLTVAGITDDIDTQVRPNGANPEIGADEFYTSAGSVQFSSTGYSQTEVGGTATITATRTGGANGAVSVDFATVAGGTATGGAACTAGIDYVNTSGTLNWADLDIAPKTFTVTICSDGIAKGDETVNLALSNPTGGVTLGSPSAAVLTILNSTIFASSVNVGTGETITSLTNPGGLFNQINTGALTSNLTVNITSDLTAETGAVALNEFAGGFTLTIQPSGGAARLISGTNATVLLDLNGADRVTIDGLNTGGNSLMIRSTGTGAAIRFINDASINTVTNSTVEANSNSSVIFISTGSTTGNDNISIVNNTITGRSDAAGAPFNSINLIGTSAAVSNTNTLIHDNDIVNFLQAGIVVATSDNVTFTNNDISQTVSRTTALFGVAVNSVAGTNSFSNNRVHDLTTTLATTGFQFNDARDTTVSRNRVYNFPSTTGSTGTLSGVVFNGTSGTTAALTVVNNMIAITPGFTNAQIIRGIFDFAFAGNTFTAHFNSVLISGTGSGASSTWACVRGTGAPTTYTASNNICFNNRTGGTGNHFAMGDQSNGTGTLTSNYNIFVGTGAIAANFFDRGTAAAGTPVDFAAWQVGGRDGNSQASNPGVGNYTVANMFVSPTDLHLANEATNPASNAGTPVAGITTDFDGQTRGATPDIGADEFFVATVADLSVTKSDAPDPVSPGGNITYTINFTNNGPDAAQSVTVTDVVPANTTFVSASVTTGAGWTITTPPVGGTGNVEFSKATVANSETAVFQVVVQVNPGTPNGTVINNSATAATTTTDPTPGNNTGTASTTVTLQSDISISKTDSPDPVPAGQNLTYTITATNNGPDTPVTMSIQDMLPADPNVTFVSVSGGTANPPGSDPIPGSSGGTINHDFPGVGPGNSVVMTVVVAINATTPAGTMITNTASASSTNVDPIPGNNSTTAVTTVISGGPSCEAPSIGSIEVQATAGTMGPTGYTTLGAAFTAINTNVHQGVITIDVCGNTTETASAILNASGAGGTYTSVAMGPVGGPRIIDGTIVGAVVKLNGADNVTIDGRIAGTGRNLTISNASVTAASAAIWLSSTGVGAGATNNIIRNLEIAGGVTNTNAVNTFGIIMSGAAITPTSGGADNDDNQFIFNRFIRSRYGILTRGESLTNLNQNTIINDNIVGPSAFGPDQIGKVGIFPQFENNCNINRNTVQFVGGTFATTTAGADRFGIALGGEAWGTTPTNTTNTNFTVTRNLVHDIIEERTFSSVGIAVSAINGTSATNTLVANNMIYNVRANGTAGDQGVGIGISGGNGDRVVFNSISMTGDLDPAGGPVNATVSQVGVRITGTTTSSNLTLKNNVISVDVTSNTATLRHFVIVAPAAAYAWGTGGSDNNVYYHNPLNAQMAFGGIGTAVPYTVVPDLTAWRATFTPNQDANSRFGDPKFVSPTADLHIQTGTPTPVESAGTPIAGVTDDFDADVRNVTTPDVGADEGTFITLPANDIGATAIIVPANGSIIPTGTAVTPQASFTNAGTATQTGVMVQFTITGPGGYNYTNTQTIATIAPGQTVTVTFAAAPAFTTTGSYNMTAAVITPDGNPANDTVNGSFTVANPVGGTVTVGSGGTYPSLTNPGGVFQAINTLGASANITIEIISDLTGETGAIRLNEVAGGFTVTIKPSGAARSVSGTAPANIGMITLNGADNVTIDGSLSGGSDRSLTFTNNQTGLSTVIWIASASAANGANNNTVKNCIINGMAVGTTAQTTAGILAGSGVTLGNAAEAPNSNNTITNNHIYRVQNSLYNQGNVGLDQNWTITNNEFGSSVVADKNLFRGMLMGNANNFVISGNFVHGVTNFTGTAGANSGIQLAFVPTNGNVHSNRITDIHNLSATGTGAFGMQLSAAAGTLNNVIANNFIGDVQAAGSATVASNGHGITINAAAPAGAYKIYHNSINMNTNQASGTSAALNLTAAVVAAGAIDLRNNILANTQTAGATRRSVHSAAAAAVFGTINYNDYFSTGSVGFIGGVDRPTLADWQTGTGQDVNSKAVDPLFVSSTDLHLQAGSPMLASAVAGTGITTDIDGQTRDAVPDIGADEIVTAGGTGALQFSAPTYTIGESGPVAVITVNRVGGSSGTVTVDYATAAGGTATGGGACAPGIDYVTIAPTTLTFLNGETSKTFNVTICNDAVSESSETVNLALSNPTGGGTLGTPNTAVLTITDDDGGPTPFSVAIGDARVFEGNAGTTNMVFNVTLTSNSLPLSDNVGGGPIATVNFATANGTATAGSDYVANSGTVSFITTGTQTVTVVINGDVVKESNEFLFVNLSSPSSNTTITDGQGAGIIVDEDRPYVADFDRDIKADYSVFRPGTSVWYVLQSSNGTMNTASVGPAGDIAVPGDYDGDGKTDHALWQTSTGNWIILRSSNSGLTVTQWGATGDKPVQGDYDGDGKTDLAIYRPSTGQWWILRSTTSTSVTLTFGISTDRPMQGDYDGDFKTDLAVYRDGIWYILRSSDGSVEIHSFGLATDKPVSGDFDGDGRHDRAIYRAGVWWVNNSLAGTNSVVSFGLGTDLPAPADFDGDGSTDLVVFRPSIGDWFVLRSSNGTLTGVHWGIATDVLIPAAYIPQ